MFRIEFFDDGCVFFNNKGKFDQGVGWNSFSVSLFAGAEGWHGSFRLGFVVRKNIVVELY